MRHLLLSLTILFFVVPSVTLLHAQGESAVPFLLVHPSPEANGWGNVGTAVVSDNPMATISNPAQLGLFSLDNYFSFSSYTPKTQWLPNFGLTDLTYSVWAMNAGYNLSKALELPFPVGIGVGYSRIDVNLGEFIRTNSTGGEIGRFTASEKSEQFSVAVGIDFYVQASFGFNFKNVESQLGPLGSSQGSGKAEPSATDFGLLLQAPVFKILKKAGIENVTILPNIEPLFDLTFGYSRANISDKPVVYLDAAQSDPLPRNATIGISAEIGLTTKIGERDWKMLTFTIAREAQDVLVVRKPNMTPPPLSIATWGEYEYQSGLGDISFFKHVIRGKLDDNDRADLHKGWQLNFGEMVYLRGGSFAESPNFGNRNYSTSGFGIRTRGLWKLLGAVSPEVMDSGIVSFFANHLDFGFDHAEYSAMQGHPLDGTTFNALTLVVR